MPVLNETWSLIQVTDIVLEENKEHILEIIIPVHPEKTTPESHNSIQELKSKYGDIIKAVDQDKPFVGGAVLKGFELVQGNYCLMLASDLETDPYLVKTFIEKAHNNEADIITASRWLDEGGFGNYNPIKKLCNWLFQKFFPR